jgi:hypothetical protein
MKRKHKMMIQECLDNFDFENVQRVMEFLHWEWTSSVGVPTVDDIRGVARRQLKRAIKEDLIFIETGGLRVSRPYGNLRLSFEIETWEAEK